MFRAGKAPVRNLIYVNRVLYSYFVIVGENAIHMK